MEVSKHRFRELKGGKCASGPVVYWMSRDQRVADNWALIYAVAKANRLKTPFHVVFTLARAFPGANLRHYDFMLRGLRQVEERLLNLGINFTLLKGEPAGTLPEFLIATSASLLVSDFDPLALKREWKRAVNEVISVPHHEVDAHNIVPCWYASGKQEFGAYTIRPKIKRHLFSFLADFPDIKLDNPRIVELKRTDWHEVLVWLKPFSEHADPVDWITPGEDEAYRALRIFLTERLNGYSTKRNNPNEDGQSNLSAYLHFGQLSAQRVAVETVRTNAGEDDKEAFLDELIVRRELSDNFCHYNPNYSKFSGFPDWAKETHRVHRFDVRQYLYSPRELEHCQTHDPLWNAAQSQLVADGKMHGYVRMYWAKKILEWTTCPEEAMQTAIYLNDKYSLDGRDPNGYAGIAWCIGGVHDRAWPERPIFGKIRYMSFEGCRRKFDVDAYIAKHLRTF